MSTRHNNNFLAVWAWRGRATVVALLVGFIASCNDNNPDVVVVSPTPAASPSPDVVVVSPTPAASPSPDVAVSPTPAASPSPNVATDGLPITDLATVVTTPDQQSLVNKQVQLTNAAVQSVVGDRTFWVGPSNTQQLLVVLDEALDSSRIDKKLDINTGQTLTLNGLIRPLPSIQEAQKEWGLSATEAQALKNQKVYLQAQEVEIQ